MARLQSWFTIQVVNNTGTRLSFALLGYFILVILLLTLNPFYLVTPERVRFTFDSDLNNVISNILLFLPIGFFYRLSTQKRGALLIGAIISISIELLQLFIPARTPSIVDILTNILGSGLGAAFNNFISARIAISKGTVGRLRLETPLMGLVYLLMALLWTNSMALANGPSRLLLTTLLGLCGAIILSDLFRHWWEKANYRISSYASLSAGIWFLLGISPSLRQPGSSLIIGLVIMVLTGILTMLPQHSNERRFEHATLKKVFPVFVLYLIFLALWYPLRPLTDWHWSIGFTNQNTETSMSVLMPRIEYLVAFTILGYLFAEWRGRAEIPLQRDLPHLFISAIGVVVTLETFIGFQVGSGASLARGMMAIISALFGGTIYHLLRAHIRFLLNH
jgi:VanZ family protein